MCAPRSHLRCDPYFGTHSVAQSPTHQSSRPSTPHSVGLYPLLRKAHTFLAYLLFITCSEAKPRRPESVLAQLRHPHSLILHTIWGGYSG
jgi:hypothetical protein